MSRVIDQVDTLITPPQQPAMTIAYARKHIKSFRTDEDVLIANWIDAATQYVEGQTGRQIITATRETWMDAFPDPIPVQWPYIPHRIELAYPPLQSVVSVEYIDGDGTLRPYSDGGSPETLFYKVNAPAGPYARRGWIEPTSGLVWPIARAESGAVRIRQICGYGDTPDDVPPLLTGILAYLVGHFDQVRNAVQEVRRGQMLELPYGVQMLMEEFKSSALPQHRARQSIWPWN